MKETLADDHSDIYIGQPSVESVQSTALQKATNQNRWLEFWHRYKRNRSAVFGLFLIIIFFVLGVLARLIAPYDPHSIGVGEIFSLPTSRNIMGTDDLGRDVFSGILYGIQVSLFVGLVAVSTSALIGTITGAISGYFGGWSDDILMRITELFLVVPKLFLALATVAIFGPSLFNVSLIIGILSWPSIARVVRAEFLARRDIEFVEAARGLGASNLDIILTEILPNVIPVVIVTASLQIAHAILLEAGLSFLGLGDPDARSLGFMLKDAIPLLRKAWWVAVFPGLTITLITLGFNLTGDGLNDALNPRLREKY